MTSVNKKNTIALMYIRCSFIYTESNVSQYIKTLYVVGETYKCTQVVQSNRCLYNILQLIRDNYSGAEFQENTHCICNLVIVHLLLRIIEYT